MSKSNPNTFRDLRASFESRSRPTTATAYRSVAGDLANMSTQQRTKRVPSLAKSIDSVLDTPAASAPVRPLAVLRPSWIGPAPSERPTTPGVEAMKQTVTVEYSAPGLQPPVYILTSLSDPQWDPIEMHREVNSSGGNVFSRVFHVEEGEYQYKFRLGEGDWWVCDEGKPTVDDGQGNKNNLLIVKSAPLPKIEQPKAEPKVDNLASKDPMPIKKAPEISPLPKLQLQPVSVDNSANTATSASAPLLKHEAFDSHQGSASEQTPERDEPNPMEMSDGDLGDFSPPTLMKHEILTKEAGRSTEASAPQDKGEHTQNASPLLPHEAVRPCSVEQGHAPLFRHESISLGNNQHESPACDATPRKTSINLTSSPPVPMEANPHDYTFEKFPIDHAGIIEKIRHAHKRLPEDQTSDENALDSPTSPALSDSMGSVPSLTIVQEADEDTLEKIREAEEQEVHDEEANGEEVDPLRPLAAITPPMTPPEPEDADFEPKIDAIYEKTVIEERIIVEIVDRRKGVFEALLDKIGGKGNAVAVAVGMLVVAAGIYSMQFM